MESLWNLWISHLTGTFPSLTCDISDIRSGQQRSTFRIRGLRDKWGQDPGSRATKGMNHDELMGLYQNILKSFRIDLTIFNLNTQSSGEKHVNTSSCGEWTSIHTSYFRDSRGYQGLIYFDHTAFWTGSEGSSGSYAHEGPGAMCNCWESLCENLRGSKWVVCLAIQMNFQDSLPAGGWKLLKAQLSIPFAAPAQRHGRWRGGAFWPRWASWKQVWPSGLSGDE